MDRIEARVRGALMEATVVCPVEGTIPKNRCADNQALKPSPRRRRAPVSRTPARAAPTPFKEQFQRRKNHVECRSKTSRIRGAAVRRCTGS
jgi:hypothetical protein